MYDEDAHADVPRAPHNRNPALARWHQEIIAHFFKRETFDTEDELMREEIDAICLSKKPIGYDEFLVLSFS